MSLLPFGAFCADEPQVVLPDPGHNYCPEQQIDLNWQKTQQGTSTYWKWTQDHDA